MNVTHKPLVVEAGTWKRILKREGEAVLTLSLRWPKLPEDRAGLRRINRCYQRMAGLWQNRWEGALYQNACETAAAAQAAGRSFSPWEAVLDFTVTYQDEDLLSLYLDAYEYAGGAHGLTVRHADTWDLSTGTPRTLASFFPGRHWRKEILSALHAQAQSRVAAGTTLYYDNWPELLTAYFDPERFYRTQEGLSIYYPLYTIAPYAEGIPVFSLPLPASICDQKKQEKS